MKKVFTDEAIEAYINGKEELRVKFNAADFDYENDLISQEDFLIKLEAILSALSVLCKKYNVEYGGELYNTIVDKIAELSKNANL